MTALISVAVLCLAAEKAAPDRQRVENLVPFDVAGCFAPTASIAPNAEGVTGGLRLARPAVLECLTDAKARGSATRVTLTFENGAVTATSVEGEAKACIEKAAGKVPWPAGAAKASIELAAAPATVKLGVNAASDIAAAI
ncbi:MAG: hypothetical protein IPJ65_03435, partial [Archangiaceae bacterium]|nr:hypothetical protein [Archangiaceae bacterium]